VELFSLVKTSLARLQHCGPLHEAAGALKAGRMDAWISGFGSKGAYDSKVPAAAFPNAAEVPIAIGTSAYDPNRSGSHGREAVDNNGNLI
jgi:hypothetical protein